MATHAVHFADKKLLDLTLPGTHDSGAYDFIIEIMDPDKNDVLRLVYAALEFLKRTPGALQGAVIGMTDTQIKRSVRNWGKTQNLDIFGQLEAGIRWFDLRTMQHDNEFYLYHGFLAHKVSEILDSVRRFTNQWEREIVVLNFSHTFVPQDNHVQLAELIKAKLGDRVCLDGALLKEKTVAELVSRGVKVVVFYDKTFSGRSRYSWLLYPEEYYNGLLLDATDIDDLTRQANRQLSGYTDARPVALGWTTTPGPKEIGESIGNMFNPVSETHDLKWFTKKSRETLPSYLASHPDIRFGAVTTDFFDESNLVDVCIARSIAPLPAKKTASVKLIASTPILRSNRDGGWDELQTRYFAAGTPYAIWGSEPNNIFMFGKDGAYAHYNGTLFDWGSVGSDYDIRALTGFSAGDVWGAGNYQMTYASTRSNTAVVVKLNTPRNAWEPITFGDSKLRLLAIGGASNDRLFVGGTEWDPDKKQSLATIWQVTGPMRPGETVNRRVAWQGMEGCAVRSIFAVAPDRIYAAVGQAPASGGLLHYDGRTWRVMDDRSAYYAIWANRSSMFAVGPGVITYLVGNALRQYPTVDGFTFLQGVYGSSEKDVTVAGYQQIVDDQSRVGYKPIILVWDGALWRVGSPPKTSSPWLYGVWQGG